MRNGFKFNGRHSSEFGASVRTKSRPIRPSSKSFTIDMPCRDGVYDFSAANSWERELFNERVFTVTIGLYAENLRAMQKKLTDISSWLTGWGELIFDDMPLTVWKGKITDEILYMPEHEGRKAVIEASFRVKPFGFCLFGTEGPEIGVEEIILNENIPIGFDSFFSFTLIGSGDINIINCSDRPVRPVIQITNASEMTLSLGNKALSFDASGTVTVDFERQNVTDSNGSTGVSGEFFEFGSGNNVLGITRSSSGIMTINVSYIPEFMYGVSFDGVDWGESDA